MAKYSIGITEAGDAGLDLSWGQKMDSVDGVVLVTKNLTPSFCEQAMRYTRKAIIHVTCTGYGGTILEPYVPSPEHQKTAAVQMVRKGFPQDQIVIRVDPIIPTEKGLDRALSVVEAFMEEGFRRFRISVIDMYPHVRKRFKEAGLPLPYGEDGFFPGTEQLKDVDAMLLEAKEFWNNQGCSSADLRIESCAEPRLKEALPCGCISSLDLSLLRLDINDIDSCGPQRPHCMCYSGKTELLSCKHQCGHRCLYCYWK